MTVRLRREDLTWQELDDETVVLDLRSSKYFVINKTGTQLWRLIANEASAEELTAELVAVHGLSPAVARAHSDEFLEGLRSSGLLEP